MNQQIRHQLTIIDSLLKSTDFSLSIAESQESAYYTGIGEPAPVFLSEQETSDVINKSLREEKMAIQLAGFYAMECGLGVLCHQTNEKPGDWLERIIADEAGDDAVFLLSRFANATWKIGQPFRSLRRITKPGFTGAGFLPAEALHKGYAQVKNAAKKLLADMQDVKDASQDRQMKKIRGLLNNQQYALEMVEYLETMQYTSRGKLALPFLSAAEDTATIPKPVLEQKIATNLAGFYALECCTNYLVTTRQILPSEIFRSITGDSIAPADKNLFSRFANATWKASQPFRNMNRIERETFTPFYFLNEADVEKDWVQIKAAAKRLLVEL